jgi:hypothetical protein
VDPSMHRYLQRVLVGVHDLLSGHLRAISYGLLTLEPSAHGFTNLVHIGLELAHEPVFVRYIANNLPPNSWHEH